MSLYTLPAVARTCVRYGKSGAGQFLAASSSNTSQFHGYRAAVIHQLGQPMAILTQPKLKPLKASEVLISVHAASVSFADILQSKGLYQIKMEPPFVPGMELAGEVVDVGPDVKSYKTGDRVVAISKQGGAFAELCVLDSQKVFLAPDNWSFEDIAGTFTSYSTAMLALTRSALLKKGETVLVTAAAGATGLAVADIAKNFFGCEVICVCGGQEKCQFLKDLGIEHTIDYTAEKIRDRVKVITGGKGVGVAIDLVGGETLIECVKSLRFEGRAVTVGYTSGSIPRVPANLLLLKSSSLVGVFWSSYAVNHPVKHAESIEKVTQALTEGKLKPHIGTIFALHQFFARQVHFQRVHSHVAGLLPTTLYYYRTERVMGDNSIVYDFYLLAASWTVHAKIDI